MISEMISLASLHAPRREAKRVAKDRPRTKEQAFKAWFEAVVNHVGDYARQREARADFELFAGRRDLGEMCGDLVRTWREDLPATVPKRVGEVASQDVPPTPPPVREGKHRFKVPCEPKPSARKPKPRVRKTEQSIEIGKRVRAARVQAGHRTIHAFAVATLFPEGTMSTLESGYSPMTPKTLDRVAALLGVSASWLLTGKGKPWKGGAK